MAMFAKALTIAVLGCIVPAIGVAAGIRVYDHDAFAAARGDAFVATADNPSAIYYNPAGLTQLEGHNARAAVNLLNVRAGYENRAFRDVNTSDDLEIVPGFFYTYSPNDCSVSFGAGYYLPFSLSTEWPENSPFRTTIVRGDVQYHTLNGVVAWQPTETLSIAAGPTFNYASIDLRRGYLRGGDEFKFTGDDYDLGFSAGVLWKPVERHAFGVSYRSPTTMKLEGESRLLPASYGVGIQDASMRLPLPQVIIAGYSFRPTPHWNLEVDVDWTDWERVNAPVLKQPSGNTALPLHWESSWAIEAGVTRYFDNGLHVSGGYVYIENSTPNQSFNPLVPDQDLHVFSVGFGGKYQHVTWDLTYQYTWSAGRGVNGSVYDSPASHVDGHYTVMKHAFSLSIGWHF